MRKWNFYTSKELKPQGWLRRQLEIQAEGLSGNLDKVWPDVKDSAWIGGDREGWERVPYWLDGFIPLAYLLEDQDMIARAEKFIDAILSKQKEDGWICPCTDEERKSYDTWAILLITKVLTVYYQCSGDERIPEVVYRVLYNYYTLLKSGEISLFDWGKFRWFEGCIAIEFVYGIYGEAWLKDLASILKEQGTDYNEFTELWKRPLNRWRFDTHIVNLAMMLKSEAVSCDLLGQEYTDNAEYLYSILKKYNGTSVETFTGDECLSGVSPIQGTELCAVVELMYCYEHLYAYTGDPKWAKRLEVIAFNALPAAISDDMWTHQYVQMSNQMACEKFPGKSLFRTNSSEAHLFGLEPHYGCCTANFSQGWPKFALSAFLYGKDGVISSVPVPSELKTKDRRILLETSYPFENTFTYTVESQCDFTFTVPVPAHAKNLTVNKEAKEAKELVFEIKAGSKQKIEIAYDAEPGMEERAYGLHTVKCGSLVFSLPVAYEKKMYEYVRDGVERKFPYCDYEYLPVSDWSYGFDSTDLQVIYGAPGEVPFSGETPSVRVKAKVRPIDWGLEDGYEKVCAKKPESVEPLGEPEEVELYPYGCTGLRMTELPFTGKRD